MSLQNTTEAWLETASICDGDYSGPGGEIATKLAKACSRNRLFAMCTSDFITKMVSKMTCFEAKTDDVLCQEGEDGCTLFVVESGRLAISIEETVVGAVGEWQSCGEAEIICKQPRRATVKATEPTRVWLMHKKEVQEVPRRRHYANPNPYPMPADHDIHAV